MTKEEVHHFQLVDLVRAVDKYLSAGSDIFDDRKLDKIIDDIVLAACKFRHTLR